MAAPTRSVLVTGGGGGLGAAVAARLAQEGWRVAVADLDAARAAAVAGSLSGSGHTAVAMDVGNETSVARGWAQVEEHTGAVTALVHAAGVILTERALEVAPRFWEAPVARWDQTLAINLRGTYLVCAEFMRRWLKQPLPNGRIVLFSSISGQVGGAYADYAASKSGVVGFMRVAARECAPHGVTMNALAPGMIDTPMLRQRLPADATIDPALVPLGRVGQPSDVAAMVSFIVSPDAAYITGATFDVNGGQRMQ